MSPKKSVLVVEDEKLIRKRLTQAFERAGFTVTTADSYVAACDAYETHGPFDVATLDVNLEDGSGKTGLDAGAKMQADGRHPSPEFLVYSQYTDADYYDSAMRIGTVAYLRKADIEVPDVVPYVRALAVRRAIRSAPHEQLLRHAERSGSAAEALALFCQGQLAPEMAACLHRPVLLLVWDKEADTSWPCSSAAGFPEAPERFFSRVQSYAHGNAVAGTATTFTEKGLWLISEGRPEAAAAASLLEGAAVVPLSLRSDLRLTVCLLPLETDPDSVALRHQAEVLRQCIQGPAMESMLRLFLSTAGYAVRRSSLLDAMSRFSLYTGQEQTALIGALVVSVADEIPDFQDNPYVNGLATFADELEATGRLLGRLGRGADRPAWAEVDLATVVRDAWERLSWLHRGERSPNFDFELTTRGDGDELGLTIERLLQWFGQQALRNQDLSMLKVSADRGRHALVFEDASRRLPPGVLRRIFDPFSEPFSAARTAGHDAVDRQGVHLPLFTAVMVAETRCDARIENLTDQLPGERGHRFALMLPPPADR